MNYFAKIYPIYHLKHSYIFIRIVAPKKQLYFFLKQQMNYGT